METYILDRNIKVFCETAKSFPNGVLEAHQKLHALVPFSTDRNYFGLSNPNEKGVIIYKAAAEELQKGEFKKHGLEEFVIKKGRYLCITIPDYMKKMSAVGQAFEKMIADPGIDPNGYCLEWYINDHDMRCLVKLKEN